MQAIFLCYFKYRNTPGPIRTGGLRFRKPTLYPAELRGRGPNIILYNLLVNLDNFAPYPIIRMQQAEAVASMTTLGKTAEIKLYDPITFRMWGYMSMAVKNYI